MSDKNQIKLLQTLAIELKRKHTITYIEDIIGKYPGLFQANDDELFFSDDYKFICSSELDIKFKTYDYVISPLYHDVAHFVLLLSNERGDFKSRLDVTNSIIIPDDICIKIFRYNIDIGNYDRESIMRRHTLNNIFNEL